MSIEWRVSFSALGASLAACGNAAEPSPVVQSSAVETPAELSHSEVIRVTLPEGVARADLANPSPGVRERLQRALRAELSSGRHTADVVLLVDRDGNAVLPELEALQAQDRPQAAVLSANELTFTYDSPANPFTPSELAQVQAWVATCYPVAKLVYGNPGFANTVNVSKGDTGEFSGFYFASTNEIVLGSIEGDVTCHEMLHAFHDDFILFMQIWEEGMTRAGEVEVTKRAGVPTETAHDYTFDVHYEELNQPTVGAINGSFGGWTQRLLRYQLGGYAWAKPLLESASFLADFNGQLYAQAAADIGVLGSPAALIGIAAGIKPQVEDVATATWFSQQHILGTTPPSGNFVYVRANREGPAVSTFNRGEFSLETNLTNVAVSYVFTNHAGAVLSSGSGVTNGTGTLTVVPPAGYAGRVKLTATATIGGAPLTSSAFLTGTTEDALIEGVFGVVEGADSGSIVFTPLDQSVSPVTVPVANGAFFAPTLRAVQGRIRYVFTRSGGGSTTAKVFTKDDDAPYFVHAKFVGPAPSAPCSDLCSNPVQFTAPYSSGNLGSAATCHQTTSNLVNGVCANFAAGRTFKINGTNVSCNNFKLPPKRNGGYCMQASAGNQPYAFFAVW